MARGDIGEIIVEKGQSGQPRKGKVFTAIHAQLDDVPFYASGFFTSSIREKIDSIIECRSQGRGNNGSQLRSRLATQGGRPPIFGNNDRTADREYVRRFMLDDEIELEKPYGLRYAEPYYYIDRRRSEINQGRGLCIQKRCRTLIQLAEAFSGCQPPV
jgi:hypothetical protein